MRKKDNLKLEYWRKFQLLRSRITPFAFSLKIKIIKMTKNPLEKSQAMNVNQLLEWICLILIINQLVMLR
jgi:hypothetical protein